MHGGWCLTEPLEVRAETANLGVFPSWLPNASTDGLGSATGTDMTASYPELAVLARRTGGPVILDGEIVALRDGRPDFGLLQSRMHVRHPPARLIRAAPVQLYLFDLLHQAEEPLLAVPYTERRARLEDRETSRTVPPVT
jgi:ATP-dependent DNA ligase